MTRTGPANLSVFSRRESVVRSYCRNFPKVFASASGALLRDEDGKDHIDFLAGCASLNYGQNDPDMKGALIECIAGNGISHGLDMHTEPKARFLETFETTILNPRGMDHKVMMTGPTGANAVEAALKLARKVTGRTNVVAFTNGFHGMTLGALAATGNAGKRGGAGLDMPGVTRMPYEGAIKGVDSLAYLTAMLDNPSSGIDAPAAFLRGVQRLARRHGALLIVDDIQSGCGRTGSFFSFEGMGIMPDLIPLAKSFSGMGLPFAVLLVRPQHDIWAPGEHNGTFRGNSMAFVTARTAVETYWKDDAFANEVRARSKVLGDALQSICDQYPGEFHVKGRGLMRGIEAKNAGLTDAITSRAFDKGLIIETSGPNDEVIKCLMPLTTSEDDLKKGARILAESVDEIMQEGISEAS